MPKVQPEMIVPNARTIRRRKMPDTEKERALVSTSTEAQKQMLGELPGWNTFTWEEKHFLAALNLYKTAEKAAKFISRDKSWLQRAKKRNHLFLQAIEARRLHPMVAAIELGQSAAAMAMDTIIGVMRSRKATNADKLSAAKEILKLDRLYPGSDYNNNDDSDIHIELKGNFWLSKEQLAQQQMEEIEGKVVTNEEYSEEKEAFA